MGGYSKLKLFVNFLFGDFTMRKLIHNKPAFLLLCLLMGVMTSFLFADATRWNINARPTSDWFSGADTPRNVPLQWMRDIDPLLSVGGLVPGRGKVYYVDSNVDNEGDGSNWANAHDTLDEAISVADPNSIILIAQGHTEALGTGADVVDVDVHGLTIIGLGNTNTMPLFDYADYDTGSFAIGADYVTLYNLRFHANVTDVNEAIEVEAGSVGTTIANCMFDLETPGTDDFLECIDSSGAASDRLHVVNCEFYMGAGAANSAIYFKDSDHASIKGNISYGDYAVANINQVTTASNHITIEDNLLFNGTIGGNTGLNAQPAIEMVATTTGIIANNNIFCDVATPDLAIVAADCFLADNTYSEDEGSDGGSQPIGYPPGKINYLVATTGTMDSTNYGADTAPIFTVTGDIMCRVIGITLTNMSSDSNETLELGVTGDTACLLIQDICDGTAFRANDVWTLTQASDTPSAEMDGEWVVIPNSLDIGLKVDDADMAAGTMEFYIQWIGLSADASVVAAAL